MKFYLTIHLLGGQRRRWHMTGSDTICNGLIPSIVDIIVLFRLFSFGFSLEILK